MSYLLQYTKIDLMTTLQTYFSKIFIKIEASLGKHNVRPPNRQPTSAKFKIQCSFILILWLKQVYSTFSDHILKLEVKVPIYLTRVQFEVNVFLFILFQLQIETHIFLFQVHSVLSDHIQQPEVNVPVLSYHIYSLKSMSPVLSHHIYSLKSVSPVLTHHIYSLKSVSPVLSHHIYSLK
jgi:hypothetical protein